METIMAPDDSIHWRHLLQDFEVEKSLIGFDLHDEVVQLLVGSKMELESIDLVADLRNEKTSDKISSVLGHLNNAISKLRTLIGDLSATTLESGQLVSELDNLLQRYRSDTLNVQSIWQELHRDLDPLLSGTVLGIVKESLNNVVKHSQATLVVVRVSVTEERIAILVVDNGQGCEDWNQNSGSIGLRGIRNRANIFGGKCEFCSPLMNAAKFHQLIKDAGVTWPEKDAAKVSGFSVWVDIPI